MVGLLATNSFGFSSWVSDLGAISRTLRHCGRILAIRRGKSLHSRLIKTGICSIVFIANNLIAMYNDFSSYGDAQRLFHEMPEKNVVSWTASISTHTHAGKPSLALKAFTQMLEYGLEVPNGYTFSAALKACAMVGDLETGKWIHDLVSAETQLQFDTVLMNAVADMYIKCGSLVEARRVFDGMFRLNLTSWNTMISGYCKGGNLFEAENLFNQVPEPDAFSFNTIIAGFTQKESPKALEYVHTMHKQGIKLDHFTFPCALKTCGNLRFGNMGRQIHSYIIKCGFESRSLVGPSLIDMYSKCGIIYEARKVFDECLNCGGSTDERLPLLNSMVSGFSLNGYDRSTLDLVSDIHSSGVLLDAFTLSSALKVCTNLHNKRIGLQLHGLVVTTGYHLDHVVGSVLVDLYAKCGNLDNSLWLFHDLPHKDLIAWTGLVTGCVEHGSNQLAFSLFRYMISSRIEVGHFVISSVLKACAALPWLQGGKQVHSFSIRAGFESEGIILTSLVDMYSKCGDIEDSLRIFKTLTKRDTVCWTGMIAGCGYNGRANKAIELFNQMMECEVEPNEITFLSVLSACRHAGLVGEACKFFGDMEEKHGLIPSMEHYCCMVDTLIRGGQFEGAKKLVSIMPYEPDETILNSLLAASVIDRNANLDKLPASHYNTSGYVTLSNVCARLGMWDGSAKLREVSRRVGVKEAGRSWVEVWG